MNPGLLGLTKRHLRSLLKRAGRELDSRLHSAPGDDPGVPPLSPTQTTQLRSALAETYFKNWKVGYLDTEVGEADMIAHVSGRFGEFCRYVLPWIERAVGLSGKDVVEIGCGTGSATVGIAPKVARVQAYDIEGASIAAARRRCEVLGVQNIAIVLAPAETLLEEVRRQSAGGCDVCLLYAVLEHQTLDERLETLRTCWGLLRPGGILVVNESPNRFLPADPHTSRLPFFQMLPDELALLCAKRSLREEFRNQFANADPKSDRDRLDLARWGRGVGHQEFELAIGRDLAELCVADSYQIELLRLRPLQPEELALKLFAERAGLALPASFTRTFIEVILRKPGGPQNWVPLRPPRSPVLQLEEAELQPQGIVALTSPRSSIEFAVEGAPTHLTLGLLRDPASGVLRIMDQGGRLLHREDLARFEGKSPHYLELTLPPEVSRLRLTTEAPRLIGGKVEIHYLGLR
jgi:2-polyprenyl-3-methyl-5-hydroxy-6-metoxy-1,4-benzoquinol methylase